MRITFHFKNSPTDLWLKDLRAALPEADISEWHPGAEQADYAIVWQPPQQLLDEQGAQLKAIFNLGAGVDALLKLQWPNHLPLVRIDDGGMAVQMAEYVSHALIRHFRELDVYESQQRVAGEWKPHRTKLRSDFPVGVMGLGVLGERVARTVAQFDFPVNGWSRSPKQIDGVQCFHGEAQGFKNFLAATRVLVNLLPLTPDTANIINSETLSQLQPGAYVINVARGAHLVEEDLLAQIARGHVAGATLDVFRTEPLPPEHAFWKHPKITITPHSSANTMREESVAQIARKLMAFDQGEKVAGLVDMSRGY
ncbi:glyoxylate/hydroxypyruvate reductase A [Diaphorobacter sp. HDW4B]|uniref:2-hydroxyacid dehydrogenase n=1 Tax=Diaphorobacter sp. HDW4B TaxID=2714925 RepID=UPI00140A1C89|nr:glyoxylate/hydroxypyruvate reductase A [Diaphorobacter sp. HDW4B]QIL71473.1 glyoxylate/hydroxypyruvate reductase A [Diaphorobacter sp. HDW4B]